MSSQFEKRMNGGAAGHSLWSVLREIVFQTPEVAPPANLKERLMERIKAEPPTILAPAATRLWHPSGLPGVEICQLFRDEIAARQTILIRMQAGSRLPDHIHGGTEECYVVEGDLHNEGQSMSAGDYLNCAAGTRHEARTDKGCLLLIHSSLHDRLAESAATT